MDREELVGIQTIWWVDYQLAVGFLTGSWKSNMDVWISNQLFGNPTACLSWPRCNGGKQTNAADLIRCAELGVSQGQSFSQPISVIVPAKANVQRHQVGMISVRVTYVVKVYT